MALCVVAGSVYLPSGELATSRAIVFRRAEREIKADYLGVVLPDDVHDKTNRDGVIEVALITGVYDVYARGNCDYYMGRAVVPEADAANFADIFTAADPVPPLPEWLIAVIEARDQAVQAAEDAAESAATVAGMQDDIDLAVEVSGEALAATEVLAAPPYRPFSSREDAQDAEIPDAVSIIYVGSLQYKLDPLGSALTTAEGKNWSPANSPVPAHYGIDGAVLVPEHFETIQAAINAFGPNGEAKIEVRVSAGHKLTAGVSLSGGDYSRFRITSVSSLVELEVGFTGAVFSGTEAAMPTLDCLIDATEQLSGSGISLNGQSSMTILPARGVRNAYSSGIAMRYGAKATYDGADFSGSARNGTTGAIVTTWGGFSSGENMIATDSGYYGPQAAHGGVVSLGRADASGSLRYSFRATDCGFLDLDYCKGNNAGTEAIRAFNACVVNAPNFEGRSAGDKGVSVSNGSIANLSTTDFSLAANYGGYVAAGSAANFNGALLFGAGVAGLYVANGAIAFGGGANARRNGVSGPDSSSDFVVSNGGILALNNTSVGGVSQQPNTVLPSGIIFDSRPWTVSTFDVVSNTHNYTLRPDLRNVVNLNPTNDRNITGVAAGFSGSRLTIVNVSSSFAIRLDHENSSSIEANRFILPFAQRYFIYPGCSVTLVYINDRWRIAESTGAPQIPTFTVATLPSALVMTRAQVFVSNAAGSPTMAYSDGTNWRRVDDNEIVT